MATMLVKDRGWQQITSSSMSSDFQSGEPSQREDALTPEDAAWIDSCLVVDNELPNDSWDSLKDALLDIVNSEHTFYHKPSVTDLGYNAVEGSNDSEGNDDILTIPKDAETTLIHGLLDDRVLSNPAELEENDDAEVVVALGFMEGAESHSDIFRVWDLETEIEEDELIQQLNKALQESSFGSLAVDDTTAAFDEQNLDDLIARVADLSLHPSMDEDLH